MSVTSTDIQPASAAASASTGDGPSTPWLSRIMADSCSVASKMSPPVHRRSAVVDGLATRQLYRAALSCRLLQHAVSLSYPTLATTANAEHAEPAEKIGFVLRV